ncbi:MAG: alpha/beta fold hydrolase, partial [Acidimicrobiia bacterium]
HGFSAAASTDFSDTVSAVGSLLHVFGNEAPLLGYSMGARIALVVAMERPESVPALIVVSGTPGIEDAKQRNERLNSDIALGRSLRDSPVEEFLDAWTSSGITDTSHLQDSIRTSDRIARQQNTSSGLASALAGLSQGVQPSLWSRLDELAMPVLLVHGGGDAKYSYFADRMSRSIPDCEVVRIADAGHNPLLDAPEETYGKISDFLERLS